MSSRLVSGLAAGFVGSVVVMVSPAWGAVTPASLVATVCTADSVQLEWSPSPDAVSYKVYMDGTFVASMPDTATAVGGLDQGRLYTFSVSSVDAGGLESGQTTIQAVTNGWSYWLGQSAVWILAFTAAGAVAGLLRLVLVRG